MKFSGIKNSPNFGRKPEYNLHSSFIIYEDNILYSDANIGDKISSHDIKEILREIITDNNSKDMSINELEIYESNLSTASQCIDVEDVAEILGEISDSLNGSNSSIVLGQFSKIHQCLQKCLSFSERSSWLNMSSVLNDRSFDDRWINEDQESDDEEIPICHLIKYVRHLIVHLRNHLIISNPYIQVQSMPKNTHTLKGQPIKYITSYFTLTLLKDDKLNACHCCDVAAVLLYILASYFKEKDSEDVQYSIPRESIIHCNEDDNEINSILDGPETLYFMSKNLFSTKLSHGLKNNNFDHDTLDPKNLYDEAQQKVSVLGDLVHKSTPVSIYEEEPRWLYSEILPVKENQNSGESRSGVCETMPQNATYFRKEEVKRRSKISYGTMDKLLQFLERDVIAWKNSTSRTKAIGIVLHKYKQFIKIKNDSYDEGVHFIKVTSSPLGSGCSGKCYLAVDNYTRIAFCLKIINSFKSSEIEVWAMLNDIKGIPKLYGMLFYDNYVCILQEFIHGPTLQSIISQSESKMNLKYALEILQNLLVTLSELHQRNVIHNDVKADNIILGNRQVLLDFGLSVKSVNGVKKGANPCGSQCHWSPEKAASEEYGKKSDVWAAIVVFVHMISGDLPWLKRFNGSQALHFIIKTKSPPLEDVPKDLHGDVLDLIKRGWMVNANLRADASELLNHKAFLLIETLKDNIEETFESIEKINRSDNQNLEEIILSQLEGGKSLLAELPRKIKNVNDDASNIESLLGEAQGLLNHLSKVPHDMICLSNAVVEVLHEFFDSEKYGENRIFNDKKCLEISKCIETKNSSSLHHNLPKNRTLPMIPLTVEEQSLSSEESDLINDSDSHHYDTSEVLVAVLLENGAQIYSCVLHPWSNTCWSEVAERCSTEVHNRNIPSFYLTHYPSGKKINALEKVVKSLINKDSVNKTGITTEESMQYNSFGNNVIQAKVVEILNDVQTWEWKVENNCFIFLACMNR